MVFFLARSALCIGIVAAAAGGIGAGRVAATVDRGARQALDGAERACLSSPACLAAGAAALSAAAGRPAPRAAAGAVPHGPGPRAGLRRRAEPEAVRTSEGG